VGRICPFGTHVKARPLLRTSPGDAGELVGQRNCEHVVVQSLAELLDQRCRIVIDRSAGQVDAGWIDRQS
jgi:hypothetical protein